MQGPSVKRSASQIGASLSSDNKQSYSPYSTEALINPPANRVHWCAVLHGKPSYKASTRPALLAALEGCIIVQAHQSLQQAGIFHRDISIHNMVIKKKEESFSWCVLINLDLVIRGQGFGITGATGKTDAKAFVAIGVLLGWICIHYNKSGERGVSARFDQGNFIDAESWLVHMKKGEISGEVDFLRYVGVLHKIHTTGYCFHASTHFGRRFSPNRRRRWKEDIGFYDQIKEILRGAQEG
ncbi:uncharacterized protein N7479_001604 [Penicillium vulpinum]|uniref:uncharacterized protein n=1 Tax=Penicillium vulpinum TaxID=29845 RepID=UPI0025487F8F|nr:uncharacterized protein N7479_001604 [Penicillium vulpinum]KAJ5971686.1 hypothetical protein N7479_001604 [Penicillium vulpinum]